MATWNPFDGIESLHREVDQAFERLGPQFAPIFRTAFLPGRAAREYPLIRYDDEHTVYVEALAPGADPASFNISVAGDVLTLSGEKRRVAEISKPSVSPRGNARREVFVCSIELPAEVDDNKVKAEYKNGLLLISLPKSEKAKPKQISVQVT